jgi:hypothetical protein
MPCVIASTLGYAGAAYFESQGAGSASLRPLLCTASAFCAFVGPWTLIAREYDLPKPMETKRTDRAATMDISIILVKPINDKMLALAETKEITALNETEAKMAMEQFEEWNKRHLVRAVAGGLGWALGTIALVLF